MKVASWKKRRIETIAQHSAQQQNDDNDDGADGSDGGKWKKRIQAHRTEIHVVALA